MVTTLVSSFLVLHSLAEFKMLCMTFKVSFGWMLGSSKNMLDATLSKKIHLAVGTITIVEVGYLLLPSYCRQHPGFALKPVCNLIFVNAAIFLSFLWFDVLMRW